MVRFTVSRGFASLALLGVAACSGGEGSRDPRGVDHDETLLSLSATGEAEAVPDVASFSIGVETYGATAKAANEANSRKADEIIEALDEFGIAQRDVQTANLSLARVDYGRRKGQYQANNILTVRLTDAPRAGEAVAAATAAGANIVSGPSLQIDDPEKANRGAYIAAYRAARTRAEAYAEAAGMKIARVLTIRDGGQSGYFPPVPPPILRTEQDAAAQVSPPPPPSFRPGVSRTRVAVQVDFALEPK